MCHEVNLPNEPQHDKINKMACAPSGDSDQTGPSVFKIWSESSLRAQSFCWFCHGLAQILSQFYGKHPLLISKFLVSMTTYVSVRDNKFLSGDLLTKFEQTDVRPAKTDQTGHLPNLLRIFAMHSMGSQGLKVFSARHRRLWSDWADTQADLSLCWAHTSFCWFWHAAVQLFFFVPGETVNAYQTASKT